jgi:hypothetical protein
MAPIDPMAPIVSRLNRHIITGTGGIIIGFFIGMLMMKVMK